MLTNLQGKENKRQGLEPTKLGASNTALFNRNIMQATYLLLSFLIVTYSKMK